MKRSRREVSGMQFINLEDIAPNSKQPRKTFYENSLSELAQSIKERGILEPIIVRPMDGKYQIVMGERRYRAAKIAGLTEVPVIVRDMTDGEAATDALLENFQREDLNPIDKAIAIEELLDFMTRKKCADTLGVSESTLRRCLELLELPVFVQQELINSWGRESQGSFTEAHARILGELNDDPEAQRRMVAKIKNEKLSVPETQRVINAIREFPEKQEVFLRVKLSVVDEIVRQMGKVRKKERPFKPQIAAQHLAAFEKTAGKLSDLIDPRLAAYLKITEMNQILSTCSALISDLDELCRELRSGLRRGDDGFKEIYIYCPLCGRRELVGSLKCMICCTILRRCLDCGNYDKMYQRCSITQDYVYMNEAESPKESSKSYQCANYKPKFEHKAA